ncbi:DinB family protein [Alkalihalobacillus sp. 1P02AB]|uniref:DinB family protein n=1 Tax=Alkalihalobacillus sp. 1P02AB TaxID=3132260 RepID=UPI0039A67999
MAYKSKEDFLVSWKMEAEKTNEVFAALTNEKLSQAIVDGHNSLSWLGWHLVVSISGLGQLAGIPFTFEKQQDDNPNDVEEFLSSYQRVTNDVLEYVETNWNDESFLQEVDMYGQKMSIGHLLFTIVMHQVHHRGQMTVLLRQAGLTVPGLFGPTIEDYA